MPSQTLTWIIAGLATAGVIIRPFNWPEAIWAVAGATLLVMLGLILPSDAWAGVLKGADVYFFLTGMMLLSEVALKEGLFDWLAVEATRLAKGSANRLFALIYVVGTIVTVFLSNDATAVVLTPAVCAAMRAAKVNDPKPYLFICAFVANAASFVLPISNPANLVVFGGGHMPPLLEWLRLFLLPSVIAIASTFFILRMTQRHALSGATVPTRVPAAPLTSTAKVAALGIAATALLLVACSAMDVDLGFPTLCAGIATALAVIVLAHRSPVAFLADVSWGVIPLVAGLFVLVEAVQATGVIASMASALESLARQSEAMAAMGVGTIVAVATNLLNNLPVGLMVGTTVQQAHIPQTVTAALLVGVDLGPNLSVTGSLATILWLAALRREGLTVSASEFLKLGAVVMMPSLALSLAALLFTCLVAR